MAWFQRKYTREEVDSLIEAIKDYNLGAIDASFSRFADIVVTTWAKQNTRLFKRSFTKDEVADLMQRIDAFKGGVVDGPLSKHIKQVHEAWLTQHT